MIVILDYGMGNAGSILNMINRIGGTAIISSNREDILQASALILPGVGAFDNGMEKIRSSGLLALIEKKVLVDKVPFLGICLGMQLLFESSEEGVIPGLGWINGTVKKFKFENQNLKVPHMGWNVVKSDHLLFKSERPELRFYFVHSYHVNCSDEKNAIAKVNYGYDFVCGVQKDNIYGIQFHPEKSHKFGMEFFLHFLRDIC